MPEWTDDAARLLESYLASVAECVRLQGDDADSIISDLRAHIESEASSASVITADRLRQILETLGSPEEVAGAPSAASANMHQSGARARSTGSQFSGEASAWRSTSNDAPGDTDGVWDRTRPFPGEPVRRAVKRSRGGRIAFWLFCFIIPLIAIVVESFNHILASIYLDPMPTIYHLFALLLIPASFVISDKLSDPSVDGSNRRLGWAVVFNGYAASLSLFYLIVYLPVMPLAVIAILFLGIGILSLSPVFCSIGGILQARRLWWQARSLKMPGNRIVNRWLAGTAVVLVLFGVLEIPDFVVRRSIEMAISDDPTTAARGISWLRTLHGERSVLEACYWRSARRLGPFRG